MEPWLVAGMGKKLIEGTIDQPQQVVHISRASLRAFSSRQWEHIHCQLAAWKASLAKTCLPDRLTWKYQWGGAYAGERAQRQGPGHRPEGERHAASCGITYVKEVVCAGRPCLQEFMRKASILSHSVKNSILKAVTGHGMHTLVMPGSHGDCLHIISRCTSACRHR